jgi:hypothetical protein
MGILMDLVTGFVALVGLFVGRIVAEGISFVVIIPYFGIILGIIGLIVAGYGSKKRGLAAAFIIGTGLGIAIPLTSLIFR